MFDWQWSEEIGFRIHGYGVYTDTDGNEWLFANRSGGRQLIVRDVKSGKIRLDQAEDLMERVNENIGDASSTIPMQFHRDVERNLGFFLLGGKIYPVFAYKQDGHAQLNELGNLLAARAFLGVDDQPFDLGEFSKLYGVLDASGLPEKFEPKLEVTVFCKNCGSSDHGEEMPALKFQRGEVIFTSKAALAEALLESEDKLTDDELGAATDITRSVPSTMSTTEIIAWIRAGAGMHPSGVPVDTLESAAAPKQLETSGQKESVAKLVFEFSHEYGQNMPAIQFARGVKVAFSSRENGFAKINREKQVRSREYGNLNFI